MSTKSKVFKRKKLVAPVEVVTEDDFFDSFVENAKGLPDVLIPDGEDEPLLQVSKFIEMPKPFQILLDAPGIPCGLITEVYGPPDSGKTTFCNEILKQTQLQGGVPVLVLSELKYDLHRASTMGLNVKRMMIRRPRTIEQVQEYIHEIVDVVKKTGKRRPVAIVWDSLGSTPCEKELDEKRGDFAADQAAAITKLLRKTQAIIRDYDIALVMINQVSTKIGVTFGKKTQAKGGFAPKYYSALRVEFTKTGRERATGAGKDADFCAIKTAIEVEKSHIGSPFNTMNAVVDTYGFVFDRKILPKPKRPKVRTLHDEEDGDTDIPDGKKDGELSEAGE